ncbi:MAG: Crp/Fnr family transcriptional regulator [Tannerella sp.]|jgi:CRP-like cAMP-binding protein|nr:Crp/Fnr family transcriptional regulator [Tannerella sp.]
MENIHDFENYEEKTIYFKDFMIKMLEIPREDLEMHLSKIITREIPKDKFIIMQGNVSEYIYYTEQGILRMYSIDNNGKEHIVQFAPEGWLVFDRQSLYTDEPSNYYIQAVEDSVVAYIKKGFLENIIKTYPQSAEKNTFILNRYIMMMQYRIYTLLSATAEERYLDFITSHPGFINRIPLYMLASYLGMTPESLSRVRNEISQMAKLRP